MNAITLPMIEHVIELASAEDEKKLEKYISGMSKDQQAELQALMWYGRDEGGQDSIPFAEYLEFSKANLETVATYMGEKVVSLPDHLREGLRLLAERNEE